MAFNNYGHFTIAKGEKNSMWIDIGPVPDVGAQYLSAHPLDANVTLVMSRQSKALWPDHHYHYGCMITNEGPDAVLYRIGYGGFI